MAENRQLVVLCDGTNNNITGGRADTNVLKLMGLLARDERQLVFYDPGVGNASALPGATLADRIRRRFDRLWGLAFGRGAYENIAEAYTFLMRNHEPGDQIFVFGFSRGAFTARAVAGLVNQFGVLSRPLENLVPTLIHVYFSDPKGNACQQDELRKVSEDIRSLCTPGMQERAKVWFVGVWDTVSSVGVPPFSREIQKPSTVSGKNMVHVRQALALDEHRRPFRPRLYAEDNFPEPNASGQTFRQEWFSGSHCDVGGGYAAGHDFLSDEAFAWLVQQAREKALRAAMPPAPQGQPVVHSELQTNPWWSVAGLCVREMRRVRKEGEWVALTPVVNASSTTPPAIRFPEHTMWHQSLAAKAAMALAAMIVAYLWMGHMLPTAEPSWVRAAWEGNMKLVRWQAWPFDAPPAGLLKSAILLDLFFIASYSYFFGWLFAAAFAQAARLRDASSRASALLNVLGLSMMVLVAGDVAENLLTLLVLMFDGWWYQWLGVLARAGVVLAFAVKCVGILGTAVVATLGVFARIRLSMAPSAATAASVRP